MHAMLNMHGNELGFVLAVGRREEEYNLHPEDDEVGNVAKRDDDDGNVAPDPLTCV